VSTAHASEVTTYGAGLKTCAAYLDAREQQNSDEVPFVDWFSGYASGVNSTSNHTDNILGDANLKEAVYRVDTKTGQMDKMIDEMNGPNGICFSPDYKKLYVADTGTGREVRVWDLDGTTVRNGKRFIQLDIPGTGAPSFASGGNATGISEASESRLMVNAVL